MNAFTSMVPTPPKHPLLSEANTELLSLRIPQTLQGLLKDLAEREDTTVNYEVRQALAYSLQPLQQVTPKPSLVSPNCVPLTDQEMAMEAFGNEHVMRAIKDVAKCIENGSIECTEEGILMHFTSFIPEA